MGQRPQHRPIPRVDTLFDYRSVGNAASRVRLRIFDTAERTVVIASEIDGNPGPAIANTIAALATRVRARYRIAPDRLVMVEHYDDRGDPSIPLHHKERFSVVGFARMTDDGYQEPRWMHADKHTIERMIGESLP